MLDTRLTDDLALRCDALIDRVAAAPIGPNAHMLRVALAECDAAERAIVDAMAICRLRDARHWIRLAYGHTLHGYPPNHVRRNLISALEGFAVTARVGA